MTHRNLFTIVLAALLVAFTSLAFAGEIMTITKDGAQPSEYTLPTTLTSTREASDYLSLTTVSWGAYDGLEMTVTGLPSMSAGLEIVTSAGKSWVPTELTMVGKKMAKVAMPLSEGAIVFFRFRYTGTDEVPIPPELYGEFYLPNGFHAEGYEVDGPIAGLRYAGGKPVPLVATATTAPGNF